RGRAPRITGSAAAAGQEPGRLGWDGVYAEPAAAVAGHHQRPRGRWPGHLVVVGRRLRAVHLPSRGGQRRTRGGPRRAPELRRPEPQDGAGPAGRAGGTARRRDRRGGQLHRLPPVPPPAEPGTGSHQVSAQSSVAIGLLLPDVLGTYSDAGNATILAQRLRWRGIPAEIQTITARDDPPTSCAVYLLGGGEDTAQLFAAEWLRRHSELRRAMETSAVTLAVCAGLQILGQSMTDTRGKHYAGL